MKSSYALAFLLLYSAFSYAQSVAPTDSIVAGKGTPEKQMKEINKEKVKHLSDSTNSEPKKNALVDTTVKNKYGDLLNDDILYNKKISQWKPFVQAAGANVFVWSVDRLVSNADFARVGPETWKNNLMKGWEWDTDRFGVNFIGHPYSGTLSFNAGRSNGYNYYQSGVFSVAGSLMWEYFGENTRPSYNDIINTPLNGAFLGEVFYRLSSNILDDRTRGMERVSREILAGLINPVRGLNRLIQGKTSRITKVEVYQKEPLNISLSAGVHRIDNEISNGLRELDGLNHAIINFQFDYGNPFEKRSRKPFDFFKLRAEVSFGQGRKVLGNIAGYGILFGKNIEYKKQSLLVGVFQYYDYLDSRTFELGAIAFGGGIFSTLPIPIGKKSNLYTNAHVAVIPFAGNSTQTGPDSSEVRDYNFGGGLEGKLESTLNLGKYFTVSAAYYYYFIHTYIGLSGDNFINILKTRFTVHLYKDLSAGFENYVYTNDRYLKDYPAIHLVRPEQKVFLQLYFEDKQRRGHYN